MGFASGSVSFCRFFMVGDRPRKLTPQWLEQLAAHAFGSQGYVASDGVETGWIGPEHLFDIDFETPDRLTVGRFVYLALRVDRTAPPPAIVNSYRKAEEQAALEAGSEPFLSKADRRAAKEAAFARAEAEAREGRFRRIAAYPVIIDLEDGVVLFGSGSPGAGDRLMALFSDTFDLSLVPAGIDELTCRLAESIGTTLDAAKPIMLAEPDLAGRGEATNEWAGEDHRFLGHEFLAWLWYRGQTGDGVFDIQNRGQIIATIEGSIALRCPCDVSGTTTIRCDAPAVAAESRAGLRIGKLPTRMGLLLASSTDDWSFTLDAERLTVSSLKIAPPDEKDQRAALEYRFELIRDVLVVLDGLLETFLRIRLESEWEAELTGMRRWATSRPEQKKEPLRMVSA